MANNQDDLLSDNDLASLAREWLGSLVGAGQPEVDPATGLPPMGVPPPQYSIDPRFQTQIGADPGPRVIGGPGILADVATGPIGGLKSLSSLLKKFTHKAGSGGLIGKGIAGAKGKVAKWVENDRQRAKRFQEVQVLKQFEKILKKNTKSSGLTWGDDKDLSNRVQVASDQLLAKLKKQGFFEFMAKRKRDDLRISEDDITQLINYYFRNY